MDPFDFVIIGAGPAGEAAAYKARELGASVRPSVSAPRAIATAPVRTASLYVRSASTRAATIRISRSRSQSMTADVGPLATGTANTVPTLARIAFGLNRSVRGEAATTASTPAPSALRSAAPRFPGFSTASRTRTSGSAGRTRSASSNEGTRTTARTPSARSPNASRPKTCSLVR